MSSISPECNELKKKYDDCFHTWYSEKYLKGDITPACEELFKDYKTCVWKYIKEQKIDVLIADAKKDIE
jgi:TRIAP1/MDM35 family protein